MENHLYDIISMCCIEKLNVHLHLSHSLPENCIPVSTSTTTVPVPPSDDTAIPFTLESLAMAPFLLLNTQPLLLRLLIWHLLTYTNISCCYLTFDAQMHWLLPSSPPEYRQVITFVTNFLIHQTQLGTIM